MRRSLLVLCFTLGALSAGFAGWHFRGARHAAERKEIGEHLRLCGECFGCRAGHAPFCESLERQGYAKAICNPRPEVGGADL